MNTIALVVSLCLLCPPAAWIQRRRSDRELAGLAGPVRSVQVRGYTTLTYSEGGGLLEEDTLYGTRRTYHYSADGVRVVTVSGAKTPGSGFPLPPYVARREADRYAAGNKVETVTYLGGEESAPWLRQTYEYDGEGRVQREFRYMRDADRHLKLFHVITYTYDARGDEVEVCWRDAAGALMDRLSYTNYKHDRRGNWVERTQLRFQVYDKNQPKEQRAIIYRVITYY